VILRYSGNDGVSDGVTEGDNSGTTITMSGEQIGLGITWGNSISRSVTHSFNHGWFETFDYLVPPVVFTRLKGGGPENNYEVQGIVFKAGKQWRRTGRTFIDVTFRQRGV
jgi:hypothetical protein